jgi:hydroxycarboxylate dehydrogenase B
MRTTSELRLDADSLKSFVEAVFVHSGAPPDEARIVSDHLVTANLMGYDSHGIIRVCQYLEDVRKGIIVPGAAMRIDSETDNSAILDCGWNFGQVGAMRAVQCAIAKAQSHHMATVVTKRCNHLGRLGTFTQAVAEKGFIAIAACNSPPGDGRFVLPWGGRDGRLSTNPMSFAIPSDDGNPILSDFSTSQVPEGKIRLYKNQKKKLPVGWIVDADGNPSTNPQDFYGPPRGAILPFGGDLGHRGYALSLLVEILAGVLAGVGSTKKQPGNGLCLIVLDISAFLSHREFNVLIGELRRYIKSSPPAPNHREVLLPGEPDFRLMAERSAHGIPVDQQTWEQICDSARSVGLDATEVSKMSQLS